VKQLWELHGQQRSIREIARILAISRNTVRKYLRAPGLPAMKARPPGPSKLDPYADFLADLLGSETTARLERYLRARTPLAHLLFQRTIDQFAFRCQPSIDKRQVRDLAMLTFVTEAANVLLLGPPGGLFGVSSVPLLGAPDDARQRGQHRPKLLIDVELLHRMITPMMGYEFEWPLTRPRPKLSVIEKPPRTVTGRETRRNSAPRLTGRV